MSGRSSATIVLWRDIHRYATAACMHFGLRQPKRIEPLADMRARFFGDERRGVIRLRVHRLGRPRMPLSRRTIFDTLAHELAHLRVQREGSEHHLLMRAILDCWTLAFSGRRI